MTMEALPQDLADFLVTKNFDLEYFDDQGQPAEAGDAKTMKFDYVSGTGKNYGTAVLVIADDDLTFFYGDNLGRGMEPEDKDEWYSFLEQLSDQAAGHAATWTPKDINQLKHTLAGIAAIKEGLFEGYYGTKKISYMGEQTQARLVINHNRVLGEADKRYRYVESLFIETAEQERFRLPFKSLAGGRAMLEHVRSGGRPYDVRGNHITEIVSEMAVLSRFNRAQHNRVFEGVTQELVESARQYYHNLQETVKHLGSSRGYQAYFESWAPDQVGEAESLVENLRNMFVEQTLDARIEAALPTLAKIQQQGMNMKEAQIFENWINSLSEGTWALPETPEQMEKLNQLMSGELIVGPDATNATELLYDIVGDDELFDILNDLADRSEGRANIWDDSDVQRRLAELGVQTPQSTAAEPADVEQDTAPAVKEGMAEGYQLDEGAVETITALVKKIPGIGKYYQMAQQYKPQLIEILKTSKSGKEVKQKMEQLAAGQSATVAESGMMKQLGGLAVGGGSILSTMWMNAMGMIDGVLANAAAGEVGGAVASGSILGLIPITLMLFAAMLLFKGSKQSSDEKAQAFQAQRGQQGVGEGDNLATFVEDRELAEMLKYAGVPIREGVLNDDTRNTWDHLLDRFRLEVDQFKQGGKLDDDLYDALYDYYHHHGAMPFKVSKASSDNSRQWVSSQFAKDMGLGKNLISPMIMPVSEGSCNMTMEGEYCPEHGLMECGSMEEDGGAVGMPYSMGEELNEIGDTPAGQAALQRYGNKAHDQVAAHWKQVHNKSHLPTDTKMAKRNAGTVAADNRIHGFGIAKNQQDKVTDRFKYRDAVGLTHVYQKNNPLEQGVAETAPDSDNRQWSNKDMERLRVATKDFDDIMASDAYGRRINQDATKQRLKTKPIAGPKGVLPEQGMGEGVDDPINSNSAMTGSYYEGKETRTQEGDALLARIKSLALLR